MKQGKVLVLTVGTGNLNDLEGSLFAPLSKSLEAGEWSEAILLPSTVTDRSAARLQERFGSWVRVKTLPGRSMENDYDACFGHFDRVLGSLISEGYRADRIVVDFTRGTKAMSAAAVLAAVRRGILVLRYIDGDRDAKGTVVAGTERIKEVRPALAMARRDLDRAYDLMHRGNFAAVLDLVPDPGCPFAKLQLPKELFDEACAFRRKADFYAAWDSLDYNRAAELANDADVGKAAEWVSTLARQPDQNQHGQMAEWLCAVACDLLENGRRRIRDQQLEDALLRGYRVLELLGQVRLFEKGHDSSAIDPNHPEIKKAVATPKSRARPRFSGNREKPTAGLVATALLLKSLDDEVGVELFALATQNNGLKSRNSSILTHGFESFAPEQESLKGLYMELEKLLRRVKPEAGRMLALAQLADLASCRSTRPSPAQ